MAELRVSEVSTDMEWAGHGVGYAAASLLPGR